jgi:hypothetical protein
LWGAWGALDESKLLEVVAKAVELNIDRLKVDLPAPDQPLIDKLENGTQLSETELKPHEN